MSPYNMEVHSKFFAFLSVLVSIKGIGLGCDEGLTSPKFLFKKQFGDAVTTYIAINNETVELQCHHQPGETINVHIHTATKNYLIVSNSALVGGYESTYKVSNTSNYTVIIAFSSIISGSVFSCTNLQTLETASLRVINVPLHFELSVSTYLCVTTYCSLTIEASNISEFFTVNKEVINDTHCEMQFQSFIFDCANVDVPNSITFTLIMSDVEKRVYPYKVCDQLESTSTPEMTSESSEEESIPGKYNVPSNPKQSPGKSSAVSWKASVCIVVGLSFIGIILFWMHET